MREVSEVGGGWRRIARAIVLSAVALVSCANADLRPPPAAPRQHLTARELLPSDLDVVLWLDVSRARSLWLREGNKQLVAILDEYGLLPSVSDGDKASLYVAILERAEKVWIACRPSTKGCQDPVVLVRGDFRQFDPKTRIAHVLSAQDLGGGWLRYDRDVSGSRSELARIYFAPPSRLLFVSTTELDAIERSLERYRGTRNQIPKESGIVSILLGPDGLSRVLESRAPAAARFIRDAQSIELELLPNTEGLTLHATIAFESGERAERAAAAFRLILRALEPKRDSSPRKQTQVLVVGTSVTIRFTLQAQPIQENAPRNDEVDAPHRAAPVVPESATGDAN